MSALAKGGRRLKSPFQGGLDLLGVSDIVVLHKASEALDLADRGRARRALCVPSPRSGGPVCRLLHRRAVVGTDRLPRPAPEAVRRGDDHACGIWATRSLRTRRVLRFELACLRELGLMPALDACAHCGVGGRARAGTRSRSAWRPGACSAPRAGRASRTSRRSRARTLEAIRVLAARAAAWRELDPGAAALAPVRATLGARHQPPARAAAPGSCLISESDLMAPGDTTGNSAPRRRHRRGTAARASSLAAPRGGLRLLEHRPASWPLWRTGHATSSLSKGPTEEETRRRPRPDAALAHAPRRPRTPTRRPRPRSPWSSAPTAGSR